MATETFDVSSPLTSVFSYGEVFNYSIAMIDDTSKNTSLILQANTTNEDRSCNIQLANAIH